MESPAVGLTSEEAKRLRSQHGPNLVRAPKQVRFIDIVFEEVTEPMILLLLAVGVVYSVWGKLADALTIFTVIALLVLAEVVNEFRAKRAIAALGRLSEPTARVIRDGEPTHVPAEDVVPGDALLVQTGTRIAADGVVSRTLGLQVDESALTGESFPVSKADGEPVYAGTVVTTGEAEIRVETTGRATRFGQIAEKLATVKTPKTPLQQSMKRLSIRLVWVAVFFSVLIPVIGLLQGRDLRTMVLTGLSLSFATIPEELPIIITMVLGLGAYRLSRRHFLVKRLITAETLGTVTTIVTDKTGTLTESQMRLAAVYPPEAETWALDAALGAVGDYDDTPIDEAIRDRVHALELHPMLGDVVRERHVGEGRKTKAVVRHHEGLATLTVSGAPEEIFAECVAIPDQAPAALDAETGRGRRTIAVGVTSLDPGVEEAPWHDLESDLVFSGLLSFEDPPREGVSGTVANVSAAGIRTIMVTGDHPDTAAAVAEEVGIVPPGAPVLTGVQIDRMDDDRLGRAVDGVAVFARTTPEHKLRIVRALQRGGEVVAVTGDGVNDALALQSADVGIAMGVRGTDVAKDAADAVLADDDYVSIAEAVFEGRTFFDNLRKGVTYYLAVKAALIGVFLLPVLAGLPLPFSPIQIILLELFMDLAASAGFVAEPPEADVRARPPASRTRDVFGGTTIPRLFTRAAFLFAAVIGTYLIARSAGLPPAQVRTLAFSAWIVGHVTLAFVSRSDTLTLGEIGPFTNRAMDVWALAAAAFLLIGVYVAPLGARFDLAPVPPAALAITALGTIALVALIDLRKRFGPVGPARRTQTRSA